jgi:hypothetical protein
MQDLSRYQLKRCSSMCSASCFIFNVTKPALCPECGRVWFELGEPLASAHCSACHHASLSTIAPPYISICAADIAVCCIVSAIHAHGGPCRL